MRLKTVVLIVAACGIAAAACVWFFRGRGEGAAVVPEESKDATLIAESVPVAVSQDGGASQGDGAAVKKRKTYPRWRRGVPLEGVSVVHERETPYTAEQQALSDELFKALDDDDRENVYRLATLAIKSENPELRREAIEALGWYGKDAIPELLASMADPDEEVAAVAIDNWEDALSQISSAQERMTTAMVALKVLTNEDALDQIGAQFANAANDRIDSESNERKASQKRVEAVQMLVDIIEDVKSNKANVSKAKELYSDISGHEWNGIDEAEKYLADPDNYDPDAAEELPGLEDAEIEDENYAEPVPGDEDGDSEDVEDAENGGLESAEAGASPSGGTPQQ